jgi:hypothetical protein
MRFTLKFILVIALVSTFTATAFGDEISDGAPTLETLRAQLLEVQAKEAELQARARQLDEDLKPENIERSLAGIGSTRPEELRESRRRQLSIERESVRAQLKLMGTSHELLESVIRTAETAVYQQSAEGNGSPLLNQAIPAKKGWSTAWVLGTLALVGEILGMVVLVFVVRKRMRPA